MPELIKSRGGAWFVLLAAALWGTTGTSQAFAPAGFDSTVIGTLRLAIGGVALLMLAWQQGQFRHSRRWPIGATFWAAAFVASYQVCFFWGVAKTGVAVGTIVGIGSSPVAGGILGLLFRGERPGKRWLFTTLLAVTGCGLLAASGGGVSVDLFGILLAVGAGVSYAAYTLFVKDLLEDHPPDAVMAVVFCLGALLLVPLVWHGHFAWLAQPRGLAVVLHLGLVTAGVAYWLFARGLQTVGIATAVTLSLAEPATAGTLGVLVLGEHLTPTSACGIALLFAGLVVLALGSRRLPKEADAAAQPLA